MEESVFTILATGLFLAAFGYIGKVDSSVAMLPHEETRYIKA